MITERSNSMCFHNIHPQTHSISKVTFHSHALVCILEPTAPETFPERQHINHYSISRFHSQGRKSFFLPSRTFPVRECLIAHGASHMAVYVSERILQHSVCKWGKRARSTGVKLKRAEGAEQDEREKFLGEKRHGGVFAAWGAAGTNDSGVRSGSREKWQRVRSQGAGGGFQGDLGATQEEEWCQAIRRFVERSQTQLLLRVQRVRLPHFSLGGMKR